MWRENEIASPKTAFLKLHHTVIPLQETRLPFGRLWGGGRMQCFWNACRILTMPRRFNDSSIEVRTIALRAPASSYNLSALCCRTRNNFLAAPTILRFGVVADDAYNTPQMRRLLAAILQDQNVFVFNKLFGPLHTPMAIKLLRDHFRQLGTEWSKSSLSIAVLRSVLTQFSSTH